MSDTPASPELSLLTGTGPAALERLRAVLAAVRVTSVFLEPPTGTADTAEVAQAVALVQKSGVAAIIVADPRLARTLKADGVHLPPSDHAEQSLAEARDLLGERFAIGVEAGQTRHDAMTLAEGGADYIAFSATGGPDAEDHCLEMIDWWAEIFEVPCIAFDVADLDLAVALADRGADFVCLRLPEGEGPAAAVERVRGLATVLQTPAVAP